MPRAIWKGAISFGLVYVPVALYPATSESGIDFDWLDRRTLDPVGYRRINKRTGKPLEKDDIVRGVKVEGDEYVVLSDEEIRAAYPKTLQTIAIDRFVRADEVPFVHLEKPYYLEPAGRGGERVYALLREAMRAARVIGIARVVMHMKEHLAALVPVGPGLVLNTLRWGDEVRPWNELKLPAEGRAGVKDGELEMAGKLVAGMTGRWQPERLHDQFAQAIHALVQERHEAGKTHTVTPREPVPDTRGATVVDLTELLRRSLAGQGGRKPARRAHGAPARKPAAARTARAEA